MGGRRGLFLGLLLLGPALAASAQTFSGPTLALPTSNDAAAAAASATGESPVSAAPTSSDLELVRGVVQARRGYESSLRELWQHYQKLGDPRAKWAEDELLAFHRTNKQAYRIDVEVPNPSLQAKVNVPEANELFIDAKNYKKAGGYGETHTINMKRAEILLIKLIKTYPACDKIGDAAYELGDVYEHKPYYQYRLAATYYERSFQWNPTSRTDARLRAARLYDNKLSDRTRATELYRQVLSHDTEQSRRDAAQRRLSEMSNER